MRAVAGTASQRLCAWAFGIRRLTLHEHGTATRAALDRGWATATKSSSLLRPVVEVSDAMLMLELVAAGHGVGVTAWGPAIWEFADARGLSIADAPVTRAPEVRVGVLRRIEGLPSEAVDTVANAIDRALAAGLERVERADY